ncbi:MAG: BglG family transcription antiterminator [Clostridium sp.]
MRKKILINILEKLEYTKMEEIIKLMNVSDRTIRSEIMEINKDGEKFLLKIVNKRGKGYKLEIESKEKFKEYIEFLEKEEEYSFSIQKEIRVFKITKIILEAKDYITIDKIAEMLRYSRSTVISDLGEVYKNLEKLGIDVEKKSRFGIKALNNEIDVRKCLANQVYKNNFIEDFIEIDSELEKIFFKVKEIFINEIIKNDIQISNICIENIFYHFKILIIRVKSENFILEEMKLGIENEKFYEISEKILSFIGQVFEIKVPRGEVLFLARQILKKSTFSSDNVIIKEKVKKDIKDIVNEMDLENKSEILEDDNLIENLSMHLCGVIERVRNNAQLKNPYFEEVNIRYQEIMLLTLNFIEKFSKRWDLKLIKDEIAFVAIHFTAHFEKREQEKIKGNKKIGILCGSEGGMSFLLKINIERAFTDFKIEILNYKDDIKKYDFIITNVDVLGENEKVIKINNIFENNEIEKVIDKIKKEIELGKEERLDRIYLKKEKDLKNISYIELLEREAMFLYEDGVVYENFKDEVLMREKRLSTAYENGIAAPHAITMNGIENVLSVILLEEEILWKDRLVNCIFLISIKKGSMKLHKKIGKFIFKLVKNEKLRERMLKVNTIEDIEELLDT